MDTNNIITLFPFTITDKYTWSSIFCDLELGHTRVYIYIYVFHCVHRALSYSKGQHDICIYSLTILSCKTLNALIAYSYRDINTTSYFSI